MQSAKTVEQEYTLIEELFVQTKQNIAYFFDHFQLQDLDRALFHLSTNPGCIFVTGVGKSGIIAKKVATTMSSSGTKALFLSPVDALHGDVGVVSQGDTVLLFSKSGESDELMQLCPALRNKGAYLIACVSKKESRLAKCCDLVCHLPVSKELCPFDLAPTTSTSVQLIFGDLLAMALMRSKNFTQADFAQNHPAGRLGRRLTLFVQDLMLKADNIPLVLQEDLLIEKLVEFSAKNCGCLLVGDAQRRLIGIFTDGDLRRALQTYGASVLHKQIGEVMGKNPVATKPTVLAYDALKRMESDQRKPITVLPVVDDEHRVVGIIRMHDIIQTGL